MGGDTLLLLVPGVLEDVCPVTLLPAAREDGGAAEDPPVNEDAPATPLDPVPDTARPPDEEDDEGPPSFSGAALQARDIPNTQPPNTTRIRFMARACTGYAPDRTSTYRRRGALT